MNEEYRGYIMWEGWIDPSYSCESCICVSKADGDRKDVVLMSETMPDYELEMRWNQCVEEMKRKIDELIEKEEQGTK